MSSTIAAHADTVIQSVRTLLDQGDRSNARTTLTAHIRAMRGNVSGEMWWLMAQAVDDPTQQADCLARAKAAGYEPPAPKPQLDDVAMPWELEPIVAPVHATPAMFEPIQPTTRVVPSTSTPVVEPLTSPATLAELTPSTIQIGKYTFPQSEVNFVIDELGKQHDHYEIVKTIMLRNDVVFADAQRFVNTVAEQQKIVIANKQLPTNAFISISSMVGGAFITILMIFYFADKIDLPLMGILDAVPLPLSVLIIISLFSSVKFFNNNFFFILGLAYLFSFIIVPLIHYFKLVSAPVYFLPTILIFVGINTFVSGVLTFMRSVYRTQHRA